MRYVVHTILLLFIPAFAQAAPIAIFGTGLNASGQLLAPGAPDPHYTLTTNFLGPGTTAYVPEGASLMEAEIQVVPLGWPLKPSSVLSTWVTDALAQWIAPQTDVVGIPGVAFDTFYMYQTTFDLTGFDLSTVQLTGHWTADNYLTQVSLNGTAIYNASGCGAPGSFTFQSVTPFTISSGFQPGINTLTFNVTNSTCFDVPPRTNPTGLLVDVSGIGQALAPVPEPATFFPAAVGLTLAVCIYRRRRKAA